MRIVVTGTSGAGKTTMARDLAARLALPHIELDAINWQACWRDLARLDPGEFARRVTEAAQADAWVVDGNYELVRDMLWRRATHVVWLDYDWPIIMARVIIRSVLRATRGTELWPGTGNRERWYHLPGPNHPIREAWQTWSQRRRDIGARIGQIEYAHLVVLRLRHTRDARTAVEFLTAPVHRVLI